LCDPQAPLREYQVVAIDVEITLNHFLDYDPNGVMYVLAEELARVRAEEEQNRLARLDQARPVVSVGLQGDAIQPLIIRVNQGECLRVTLSNGLEEDKAASFHLHGSSLHLADTGVPAIATNPQSIAASGATVVYQWMVDSREPEGTHYFHSHGDTRVQTGYRLFGAVIVEPEGSAYLALWAAASCERLVGHHSGPPGQPFPGVRRGLSRNRQRALPAPEQTGSAGSVD
jgi:hypothetical protein